jgi:hypothetical protein
MKFVVAGNYAEYKDHIARKGYDPFEYVYVSDPMQLRGYIEIEGFYIGSYESRPDIDQIRTNIAFIKAKSELHTANSAQVLPNTSVWHNSRGFEPTSIMLKKPGKWEVYDLKANTVTSVPITDDV